MAGEKAGTMTENTARASPMVPPLGATVALVGTLAAIYMVSQFLRNSVGVIAPDLAREIGLTAGEIGLLSSAFFLAFAAAQFPLGVALDRYGPRACMLVCTVISVIGAGLFAAATTTSGLIVSRVLMGLGTSCFLMAPLALYARRFPPERFTTLAALQLGVGSIGTLLVTAPLAWAAATIGWRTTFVVVGAFMLGCGLLVLAVVRDEAPKAQGQHHETLRESLVGVLEAARLPGVGPLFLMQLTAYSSFVFVVGLWGGPYLTHVYGYGLTARGDLLLVAAVAQILGLMAAGYLERRLASYKAPVMAGALATAGALALIAVVGRLPPTALVIWIALFGFVAGYVSVLIAHGKALLPPHLVGRGMTLLNVGTMGGAFISQVVSGGIIGLFPSQGGAYPLVAYQVVFAVQAAALLLTCLAYRRVQDPHRALAAGA
ncbi:MAG: MFS transporter [Bradyrhizobiaceae bacterium]|nr:MAG: MFS transporter [Bradyrhizobiaceae bacterium]